MTEVLTAASDFDIASLKLNPVQREAVLHEGGPQLVFAGAGTGKTRVLTAKIAYLIRAKSILPDRVFAATFTNKAAREMQSRIESLVGIPCAGLWIGTFHSLCARILRREASRIGYEHTFTIYDRDDQMAVLKGVLDELGLDERSMPPKLLLEKISRFKNACATPQEIESAVRGFGEREAARVYAAYCAALRRQQAMDFDDLITNVVYLFRDGAVAQRYRRAFDYVLVDEYQDTNLSQFYLVRELSGGGPNLFVVGDDDQSIYGWRGATIENILHFEKQFRGTKVFKLEQNYRSTQAILDFAHAAIAPNVSRAEKRLWTDSKKTGSVGVTRFRDDRQEADEITSAVGRLIENGTPAGEICILFRTNAQSRAFEESFRRSRIPYVLVGTTGFYERKEIRDCLAYLRLVVNPLDDTSFGRIMNVPPRGLGDKAHAELSERARASGRSMLQTVMEGETGETRAAKGLAGLRNLYTVLGEMTRAGERPERLFRRILDESGYLALWEEEKTEEGQSRVANINELYSTMQSWSERNRQGSLGGFLEEVSLVSEVDTWEQKDESVNLMTLHCAKGLEFRAVFLTGLEDGLLPSRLSLDDDRRIEEERRLLYVGTTRAREVLECSYVMSRRRFGAVVEMMPSRFLGTIPGKFYRMRDEAVTFAAPRNETRAQGTQSRRMGPPRGREEKVEEFSQETVQFRIGQFVTHDMYGRGRVVNLSGFGEDLRLTVLFDNGDRKKLIAKFAKLEPV
jgi:DNA helicase-2/ATP-dependent DNA helicase PcrA